MSSPPIRQFALQGAAVILVLSVAWPYYGFQAAALPWCETSLAIGAAALLFATVSRQPWWWRIIHAVFMPLVWFTHQLSIDPGWFLLATILLLVVYRGALTGQVPLYLSNQQTGAALSDLLARRGPTSFFVFCVGIGSTTVPLADQFPDSHFTGYENAPLTWLAGWLLSRCRSTIRWRCDDLWHADLGE